MSLSLSLHDKNVSKMWLIRRIKGVKLDSMIILDYYCKEIRPLAEQGVAIWNSGITKSQIMNIEIIQKVALKIILRDIIRGMIQHAHYAILRKSALEEIICVLNLL